MASKSLTVHELFPPKILKNKVQCYLCISKTIIYVRKWREVFVNYYVINKNLFHFLKVHFHLLKHCIWKYYLNTVKFEKICLQKLHPNLPCFKWLCCIWKNMFLTNHETNIWHGGGRWHGGLGWRGATCLVERKWDPQGWCREMMWRWVGIAVQVARSEWCGSDREVKC